MLRQTDPFLRERLHDLDDLAHRLLAVLTGSDAPARRELPDNAILVARTMAPAALLDYDRAKLRGVLVEEGGPMSHVTLVARALGIAMVGQIENATGLVEPGDAVIVDGATGDVHIRPGSDVEHSYADKVRLRARRQDQYRALRALPCITCDGAQVSLNLNAGLLVDLPHVAETGADGIGLFRTELQFMLASALPRTEEQRQLYAAVLDGAAGRPVTFRTLDVGGDKVLPYLRTVPEDNPALGWRAIRLSLDRPALLRTQVRALLRAAAGRDLKVMFPMIASMERELRTMEKRGQPVPDTLKIGLMLEVPSLLFELDEVMRVADFVSVGSNDLLQYLYAADRGNARVADRFDPLSPAPLRALRAVVERARAAGREVTLCGELASKPIEALALIGVGFRSISLSASAFGPVKAMLLGVDSQQVQEAIAPFLGADPPARSARDTLREFAAKTGVSL
jgi:phosphotransferase system, enzyme I, PtsP